MLEGLGRAVYQLPMGLFPSQARIISFLECGSVRRFTSVSRVTLRGFLASEDYRISKNRPSLLARPDSLWTGRFAAGSAPCRVADRPANKESRCWVMKRKLSGTKPENATPETFRAVSMPSLPRASALLETLLVSVPPD